MTGHRDDEGARMGMWLFLFSEILLFGGLFLLYAVYRSRHPADFHHAAEDLDRFAGTLNTVILLTSSLFMALSIRALRDGARRRSLVFQGLTILLGAAFLCVKYVEWSAKIRHGIYPDSALLLQLPKGEILYYGLYFVMTGLHGVHVVIGVAVLAWMFVATLNKTLGAHNHVRLENSGLYWHLVDTLWVYLFPLFYLIT